MDEKELEKELEKDTAVSPTVAMQNDKHIEQASASPSPNATTSTIAGSHHTSPSPSSTPHLVDPYPPSADKKPPAHIPPPENGLEKVLSKVRSQNNITTDPGPPPDGGIQAWTQILVGHLVVANTWGIINTFGVFQTYYLQTLGHPPSDISWLGSVQPWLLFFVGTFSGRLSDAGYYRFLIITGSFVLILGVFMTSLCTTYWQLFLAQGICIGLGNGIIFCPSISVASTYFSRNRSLAIGIAAAGTTTGGLIYPAVVQSLLPKIGFGWSVRVVGFIMLALQAVVIALAKPRLPPRRTGPLVEWQAFREAPYTLFAIGMFFCFWGLYVAFYYIGAYGVDEFGLSQAESIDLLLIMNGLGLIGRVIPPYFADRNFGPLNSVIPFAVISAILTFCWAAVNSRGSVYAFAALYGLFVAGIQSLFPATTVSLTTDINKAGVRTGMVFTIVSFATLTGTPIAGALIEREGGGYLYTQMFAGATFAAGSILLIAARLARTGFRLKVRM